jgi:hypothetical protein
VSGPVPDPAATDEIAEWVDPADVPEEWVEAAAFAMYWGLRETWEREPEEDREDYLVQARQLWPLVSRMVADAERAARVAALTEAEAQILTFSSQPEHSPWELGWASGINAAACIVAELHEAQS